MPTLLGAHFGHPSGGFFLSSDFFIRDCQLPLSLKTFGFGPGLALGRESTLGLTFFHLLGSLHFRLLVHEPPPWGGSYSFRRATKSTMPPMRATAPAMGGNGTLCVFSRVA